MSDIYPAYIDETTGDIKKSTALDRILTPISDPETISMTSGEVGAAVICTPVYCHTDGTFKIGKADASATAEVIALVAEDPSIAGGGSGALIVDGPLVATDVQWKAVTDDAASLTPGSKYFLSDATSGKITKTPPTAANSKIKCLGRALSITKMLIQIRPTIHM